MSSQAAKLALAALAAMAVVGGASSSLAQEPARPNWAQVKCERYAKGWAQALARQGTTGLGRAFLERHAAFVASGCAGAADVCARSSQELALANTMVIVAMNAGAASTFPPFACRD